MAEIKGYFRVNNAIRHDLPKLKGAPMSCFIALLSHTNGQGIAWPSLTVLTKETGYCRKQVWNALAILEQLGYLQIEHRKGLISIYQLTEPLSPMTPLPGNEITPPPPANQVTKLHQGRAPNYTRVGNEITPPLGNEITPVLEEGTIEEGTTEEGTMKNPPHSPPKGRSSSKKREPELLVGFDEFWQRYPKKVAKQPALKAWLAQRKARVDADVMVRGAENYAAHCLEHDTEEQFILYPPTFLNQARYQDYQVAASQKVERRTRSIAEINYASAHGHYPDDEPGDCEECKRLKTLHTAEFLPT